MQQLHVGYGLRGYVQSRCKNLFHYGSNDLHRHRIDQWRRLYVHRRGHEFQRRGCGFRPFSHCDTGNRSGRSLRCYRCRKRNAGDDFMDGSFFQRWFGHYGLHRDLSSGYEQALHDNGSLNLRHFRVERQHYLQLYREGDKFRWDGSSFTGFNPRRSSFISSSFRRKDARGKVEAEEFDSLQVQKQ